MRTRSVPAALTATHTTAHGASPGPCQRRRVSPFPLVALLGVLVSACGLSPEELAVSEARKTMREADTLLRAWDRVAQACEKPSTDHVSEVIEGLGGIWALTGQLTGKPQFTGKPPELDEPLPVFLLDGDRRTKGDDPHLGVVSPLRPDDPIRPKSALIGSHSHLCKRPLAAAYEGLKTQLDEPLPNQTVQAWKARNIALRESIVALGPAPQGDPTPAPSRFSLLFSMCSERSLVDYNEVDETGSEFLGTQAVSLSASRCRLRLIWLDPNGDILGVVSATSDEHEPETPKAIAKSSVNSASTKARNKARTEATARLSVALGG